MPSDLEQLTRLLSLQDEVQQLRDTNIHLRVSCAMWQRLYERALERANYMERPTTRRPSIEVVQ